MSEFCLHVGRLGWRYARTMASSYTPMEPNSPTKHIGLHQSLSSSDLRSRHSSVGVPSHQGWLHKRNTRGVWQQRWCTLQGSEFRYYESMKSTSSKGVINMTSVLGVQQASAGSSAQHEHCFDILCRGRTYHMSAPAMQAMSEWMAALEGCRQLDALSKQARISVPDVIRAGARQASQKVPTPETSRGTHSTTVTSSTAGASRLKVSLRLAIPAGVGGASAALEAEGAVTAAMHAVLRSVTHADAAIETHVVPAAVGGSVCSSSDAGIAEACALLGSLSPTSSVFSAEQADPPDTLDPLSSTLSDDPHAQDPMRDPMRDPSGYRSQQEDSDDDDDDAASPRSSVVSVPEALEAMSLQTEGRREARREAARDPLILDLALAYSAVQIPPLLAGLVVRWGSAVGICCGDLLWAPAVGLHVCMFHPSSHLIPSSPIRMPYNPHPVPVQYPSNTHSNPVTASRTEQQKWGVHQLVVRRRQLRVWSRQP